MFHPFASQRSIDVRAALDLWGREADGFRGTLLAAREGRQPTSLLLDAVEEAHDTLIAALDDIDRMLSDLPPGHPDFRHLLLAQTTALGLLDSVGKSLDRLSRLVLEPMARPSRIRRAPAERSGAEAR